MGKFGDNQKGNASENLLVSISFSKGKSNKSNNQCLKLQCVITLIKAKNDDDMDKNFSHWHEKKARLSSLSRKSLPLEFTVK